VKTKALSAEVIWEDIETTVWSNQKLMFSNIGLICLKSSRLLQTKYQRVHFNLKVKEIANPKIVRSIFL